jgi:uncharacterized membrane protein
MTFSQHLVLWLHVAFVIFTIGPVTLAVMSTPRYIRKRHATILRYLSRITFVFTIGTVGVLVAGLFLAQMLKEAGKPWVIVSATLYVVAVLLLLLIVRDQRRAIRAVEALDAEPTPATTAAPAAGELEPPAADGEPAGQPAEPRQVASVERGRVAMTGGLVGLIWLVILVLMVWNA